MDTKPDYSDCSALPCSNRKLHPDGQPWKKCCRGSTIGEFNKQMGFPPSPDDDKLLNCAFIDKRIVVKEEKGIIERPKQTGPIHRTDPRAEPFVCYHRTTDDGYWRVCAGWHATWGKEYGKRQTKNEASKASIRDIKFVRSLFNGVSASI
jgi:hypothetical protein